MELIKTILAYVAIIGGSAALGWLIHDIQDYLE